MRRPLSSGEYNKDLVDDLLLAYSRNGVFGEIVSWEHNGMICSVDYNPLGARMYGGPESRIRVQLSDGGVVDGTLNGYVELPDSDAYKHINLDDIECVEATFDAYGDPCFDGGRIIGFDCCHAWDWGTVKYVSEIMARTEKMADSAYDMAEEWSRNAVRSPYRNEYGLRSELIDEAEGDKNSFEDNDDFIF